MKIYLPVLVVFGIFMFALTDVFADESEQANTLERMSKNMIVTENCNESVQTVLGELIKYYVDRGEFDSADALIKISKDQQKNNILQSAKSATKPKSKKRKIFVNSTYPWISGYF